MDSVIESAQLDGWIPFQLHWKPEQPTVDWCYFGEERFTDPFFTETTDRCLRHPFNLLFRHQTPIAALEGFRASRPGLSPDGFIFHLSRSGSTLASQMLAALDENIVISEARVIDSAVRSYQFMPSAAEDQRVEWLRWIVEVLGRPRGAEKYYFIKFDAWNMIDFPVIRRAFPNVPWIFVYRDPVEVMVSHFDRRGAHMIPGALDPRLFGMDRQNAVSVRPEEFCARVLRSICNSALRHCEDGGLLINYSELPEAMFSQVIDFFGISYTANDLETIRSAAKRDAKNPAQTFENDSPRKQEKASAAVREATAKWLYPVYEQLEAARTGSRAVGDRSQAQRIKNELTQKITGFLKDIGLEIIPTRITGETFLPGILVAQGKLLIDEDKLLWPGDLLHEAGHLAVAPAALRPTLTGEVILPDVNLDALESQAMSWSYAASLHLGLDPKIVFHEGGYRGHSAALLRNFEIGVPLGVNGLQEAGMTITGNATSEGLRHYPHMLKWLRD
jgi:hypothetical protein